MSDRPTTTTTVAAQLAQIRDQVRSLLPEVQGDEPLRRALLHTQSEVERRLKLPAEPTHGRTRQR